MIRKWLAYIHIVLLNACDPSESDLGYSRWDLPIDQTSIDIINEYKVLHESRWQAFHDKYTD